MPTADRTTIRAALAALTTGLQDDLVADPPTPSAPFRSVAYGTADGTERARPFLMIALQRTRPLSSVDGDRLIEVTLSLSLYVDIIEADPHATLLDAISAVEDYFDATLDAGIIEGADGFDDRTWTFGFPKTSTGARLATATSTGTFVVKVEREQNRVPAA